MAVAVGQAAYGVDEDRAASALESSLAGRQAAELLDVSIQALGRRANALGRSDGRGRVPRDPASSGRTSSGGAGLDPAVFDGQTVAHLLEFLQHTRQGLLTAAEIAEEAVMWRTLLDAGWPEDAADAIAVAAAVDLLAAVPVADEPESVGRVVEPANDVERAMAAVSADAGTRPKLWRAIHEGQVVLPVMAYELVRPEGSRFKFLSVPTGFGPVVFGFTSEERFDASLPEGTEMSRIVAPGDAMPKFWPAGHWLVINPGYHPSVMLSPAEITGLPHGVRSELPHPRAVHIEPPDPHDDRLELLTEAVTAMPGVDHLWWARVRGVAAREGAPWRDVLVVAATSPEHEASSIHALAAGPAAEQLPGVLVLGRQVELGHPFIEAVVFGGRRVPGVVGG
jgi:hypothetical protein